MVSPARAPQPRPVNVPAEGRGNGARGRPDVGTQLAPQCGWLLGSHPSVGRQRPFSQVT